MSARLAVLPFLALIAAAGARSSAAERRDALYYSDLGPEQIDVSAYPERTRKNYAVYARACSRCHGLARSINAPFTSRGWWEFYMTGMRLRGRASGRPLSRDEVEAVLDFLEYDSRVRKVEQAAAFQKSTDDLKRRFAELVDRRMSELQNEPQPRLLPNERPRP
jgi:mono/diheme cytochrome c family protein